MPFRVEVFGTVASPNLSARKGILALRHAHPTTLIGGSRLSRSGDRAANSALYIVTIVRMRHHQPTRDYVERRTAEGTCKREIIRCLKRYIAREVFHDQQRWQVPSR